MNQSRFLPRGSPRGERAYIVTQSIKKLKSEEKEWVLNKKGFKRVSDDQPVDIAKIPEDDNGLYYKDEPYTTDKLHQRLIVTYSPKYALYQKTIRGGQVERAEKMLSSGKTKKNRKNPNDPAELTELAQEVLALTDHDISALDMISLLGSLSGLTEYELVENRIPYDGLYTSQNEMLVPDFAETIEKLHEALYE